MPTNKLTNVIKFSLSTQLSKAQKYVDLYALFYLHSLVFALTLLRQKLCVLASRITMEV